MKSKILIFMFASALMALMSTSCDFYYENPNFYISYIEVQDSPVFILPTGGNIEVEARVGNSETYINCYYQIFASTDRYLSYDDIVLYSNDVYIGAHDETINKSIPIDSYIPDGFYYVGIRIKNSSFEITKVTDYIAFHKNDTGTTPSELTILNQSEFSTRISFDGHEILYLPAYDSKTLLNVPSGNHTLKADLEKFNVNYTYGPDNVSVSGYNTTWTINGTLTGDIYIDNSSQYDAKIYVNNVYWGIIAGNDYEIIDNCLPGYYTLKAISTDGNWSWQDKSFNLHSNDTEYWTLGNPPSGAITIYNDSSEDIDVYLDNQFAGSIFSGRSLQINNVPYGTRKLHAEARYSSNSWGPININFNGFYLWTIDDYNLQNNVTFDNYTSETISVYIDGYYEGVLYPYDVRTITNVGIGSHKLYAESYYGVWGPRWIYLDPGESYTWELWP